MPPAQVISQIMATYRPEAVVMQCGADSLTGDRLGCFNLTVKGAPRSCPPPTVPLLTAHSSQATPAAWST